MKNKHLIPYHIPNFDYSKLEKDHTVLSKDAHSYNGEDLNEVCKELQIKNYKTFEEQMAILEEHGCIVEDREYCIQKLKEVNYYRLGGYLLPFKIVHKKNKLNNDYSYKYGTTFNKIIQIYEFDEEMRILLFKEVVRIETFFRTNIAYFHSQKYGPIGYYNKELFNTKKYNKFLDNFYLDVINNTDKEFIEHHLKKYQGFFPLWVAVELFSFGKLSRFYDSFNEKDKQEFISYIKESFDYYRYKNITYKDLSSYLSSIASLRNMLAHHNRLYFLLFPQQPNKSNQIFELLNNTTGSNCRLWIYIIVIYMLFPFSDKQWERDFFSQIKQLINKYRKSIKLEHIGFPTNYINLFEHLYAINKKNHL